MKPDPARDQALQAVIRQFLEGQVDRQQLDAALREMARNFEAKPYTIGLSASFENPQPDQRMFEYLQVVSAITSPILQAYWNGDIAADTAAIKVAPFFLLWGGWGVDQPSDAGPDWRERFVRLCRSATTANNLRTCEALRLANRSSE